ncbi:MAG: NAD(P)H-dependent oxidoreductase [Eubacterium sp.]|nr:NAD(P)H-dependent oxidoreductase [Eubacterium sp.]
MKLAETKKKILLVNACVRPESRTMELAREVLGHLDGVVEEVNIEKERILPLTNAQMEKRQAACDAGVTDLPMMKYAWQFAEADEIVVAAPYWDLSFPAILKAYFEQITVSGVTFKNMGDGSYKKLCKAEKLYYVMTAGGPIYDPNLGYEYVRTLVSEFYGIDDTTLFTAEMLDVDGADVPGIMKKAASDIEDFFTQRQ